MEEKIYQGHVYRRAGPGQPWQLVGPAQQASPQAGRVIADPYKPAQERRAEQDQGFEAERLRIARAGEDRQAATLPYDVDKARSEAAIAAAKAAAANQEQAAAPNPEMARVRTALKTDSVLEAIGTARRQIKDGWATGNIAGTGAFQGIPWAGQNSANLHSTLSGLQGSIINDTLAALKAASANGASGYGSLTESEAQRLAAAVGALQQTQDAESLERNLARVEKHYRNSLALLNNEDPRLPEVAEKYGIGTPSAPPQDMDRSTKLMVEPGAEDRGQIAVPTGKTRTIDNPALAGVNARVNDMIRKGKSSDEIFGYLSRVGVDPATTNIGQVLQWRAAHPEYGGAYSVDIDNQVVPMSDAQQMLNKVGSGPLGAAAISAADAVSFGTLDNLTANPEVSRALMAGVREQNPWSSLAGEVGGGALTGLGIERSLGRLGLGALGQARGGDALYGAAYGAGNADNADSRIIGALMGTATGSLGGVAGRQSARVGGRAISGIQDVSRTALDRAGVRLSPGQVLGGRAKALEDRLTSIPVLGDAIQNRRREGIADFNQIAFDQALAPIGQTTAGVTGEGGVNIARALRSDAYDQALGPVNVAMDPEFGNDITRALMMGDALPPEMAGHAANTLRMRVDENFSPTGELTGNDFQQSMRGLRRDASAVEAQPYGYDFGEVTREAEGALEGLLERQAPGAIPAYRAANEANRNVETLREAVNAARNSGSRFGESGMVMPSQLATAAASSARRFGGTHGTTQQPFFDLTRAGQEVLPSAVPDSGTAGRLLIPALAGGLAGGGSYAAQDEGGGPSSAGIGVIAALLAGAPYSRPGSIALQRALLAERPDIIARIGNSIHDNDTIAGLLARPLALTAVGGQ